MAVELTQRIWNEKAMMDLLGVSRLQLGRLRREKGLPSVELFRGSHVFLAEQVNVWMQERLKTHEVQPREKVASDDERV